MSLYDRLVPAEALRFDRTHPMTVEPVAWHLDQLRYVFAESVGIIFEPFGSYFADVANVIADAARAFPDIFPIITETQPVVWPEDRP